MGNWSRRDAMTAGAALGATLVVGGVASASPNSKPAMTTYRDPNCGCCGKWIELARAAGYPVTVVPTREMAAVKSQLAVPDELASCHTTSVGGYVVEGHVPFAAVDRLLRTKPVGVVGIALPGMPAGSPGMEAHGHAPTQEKLKVIAFTKAGGRSELRY